MPPDGNARRTARPSSRTRQCLRKLRVPGNASQTQQRRNGPRGLAQAGGCTRVPGLRRCWVIGAHAAIRGQPKLHGLHAPQDQERTPEPAGRKDHGRIATRGPESHALAQARNSAASLDASDLGSARSEPSRSESSTRYRASAAFTSLATLVSVSSSTCVSSAASPVWTTSSPAGVPARFLCTGEYGTDGWVRTPTPPNMGDPTIEIATDASTHLARPAKRIEPAEAALRLGSLEGAQPPSCRLRSGCGERGC